MDDKWNLNFFDFFFEKLWRFVGILVHSDFLSSTYCARTNKNGNTNVAMLKRTLKNVKVKLHHEYCTQK